MAIASGVKLAFKVIVTSYKGYIVIKWFLYFLKSTLHLHILNQLTSTSVYWYDINTFILQLVIQNVLSKYIFMGLTEKLPRHCCLLKCHANKSIAIATCYTNVIWKVAKYLLKKKQTKSQHWKFYWETNINKHTHMEKESK